MSDGMVALHVTSPTIETIQKPSLHYIYQIKVAYQYHLFAQTQQRGRMYIFL